MTHPYDADLASSPEGAPRVVRRTPLRSVEDRRGMRSRWIRPPEPTGWTDFALSEWELQAAGWADFHPHSETNLVLEGELHVQSADTTVIAVPGDAVTVPAGQVGRYWAPAYARMIAIYGPNPDGDTTEVIEYWDL